jgi:hypothetical protein
LDIEAVDQRRKRIFRALLIGFGGQLAGRLLDLQWHLTHDDFEGGLDQLQAHWLIWLATAFVLWVAATGIRDAGEPARRGYLLVLVSNLAYAALAIVHFFQHVNGLEVDWAHILLLVSNIAAALGVVWVVVTRLGTRRGRAVA